ncbi:MAG: type II toxin-antitoxin system RelE/ParE family toxin [Acidobacteriota bacterium]
MTRTVRWTTRALKDLRKIGAPEASRVVESIHQYATSGEGNIRRLQGIDPPLFRMRIGDLRVLFRQDEEVIDIERVLPRDKAYR